jgi:hypothetical protein
VDDVGDDQEAEKPERQHEHRQGAGDASREQLPPERPPW